MHVLRDNDASPELSTTFSIRFTTPEDRPHLLAAAAPIVSPLRLAYTVDTLLAHPSVHPYSLVEKGEMLTGVAPIMLVSHLAPGGLVAWLPVGVTVFSGSPATRDAALMAINEYTRAHGILHVLLPPAALSVEDATVLGFAPDASGC